MRSVRARAVVAGVNLVVLLAASWTALAGRSPAEPVAQPAARRVAAPVVPPPPAPVRLAPSVVPPERRYAVIVGVAAYQGRVHDTIGGKNDAAAAWAVLVAHGWKAENITLLTDAQATGSAVRAALAWLVERSAPDTFTFFHYSGHVQRRSGHQMLWPADNVYLPDTEVVATLGRLRGSSWLNFAGCHAAGFDDGLASPARLVTASSQVTEKSFEMPDWGMSVWAGTLFDQAFTRRLADQDRNGIVTLTEALGFAGREAAHVTRFQGEFGYSPQHPYTAGGLGTGWALSAPPTLPGATLP